MRESQALNRIGWLATILCLTAGGVSAEEVVPVEFHKSSIKAYPYVYYTPETQLAFGVGGIMTFYAGEDSVLRPSSTSLSGYYTSNGQWKIGLIPKIYYSRNERYVSVPASFGHYESKFWGVGNDTPDIPETPYLESVVDVEAEVQWPPLLPIFDRSGAIYHFAQNRVLDPMGNPNLQDSSTVGADGGILSGVGVTLVTDSRNETFYPTRGAFHSISAIYYPTLLGSDYEFTQLTLDFREYLPAWGEWGALAFQLYGEFSIGSAPFYKLPALGGSSRMRGYFYGRYRDKAYVMIQAEYRRHLWWKFGGVFFFGGGQVGPHVSAYRMDSFHASYGIGLRYLFNADEHVNIRVDLGFGKNDSTTGVYFGVEEAF